MASPAWNTAGAEAATSAAIEELTGRRVMGWDPDAPAVSSTASRPDAHARSLRDASIGVTQHHSASSAPTRAQLAWAVPGQGHMATALKPVPLLTLPGYSRDSLARRGQLGWSCEVAAEVASSQVIWRSRWRSDTVSHPMWRAPTQGPRWSRPQPPSDDTASRNSPHRARSTDRLDAVQEVSTPPGAHIRGPG